MENENKEIPWEQLSYEEKTNQLFLRQKKLLETFLEHRAISREQFEKSLHDMREKMGYRE